jgi:hypothetical protein
MGAIPSPPTFASRTNNLVNRNKGIVPASWTKAVTRAQQLAQF